MTVAALKSLLQTADMPAGLYWGVSDISEPAELYPEEASAMARAIPARRREFAAGRLAARRALAALGHPATAIPMAADRAPVWPDRITGSISHCNGLCVAVVASRDTVPTVGLDLDDITPLEDDLIPVICTEDELAGVAPDSRGLVAKRIFSLKEAAFKAQYPLTGRMIGFHDAKFMSKSGRSDPSNRAKIASITMQFDFPDLAAMQLWDDQILASIATLVQNRP